MEKVILEKSTNTHVLESETSVDVKNLDESTLLLKVKGKGVVTHGQHGTVVTESPTVIKYVQKELNPVTRMMQNAYD
jgi:hypothetical protein